MVMSKASTVKAYLDELPAERRKVVSAVRKVVREHLPAGYTEAMNFGMICYGIPLKDYPDTYNGQPLCFAALAAQKHHYALYLMGAYTGATEPKRLAREFKKRGKTLDMGKSCIRFKQLEDLPLDVIGDAIASTPPDALITHYEAGQKKRKKAGA
jgi:hypothetical protein